MQPADRIFTTGLIIARFDTAKQEIVDAINVNRERGLIDEALVIVPPYAQDGGSSDDWQQRVTLAEQSKYVSNKKQYDVWHQMPNRAKTNEEYVAKALKTISEKYSHQAQLIIFNEQVS